MASPALFSLRYRDDGVVAALAALGESKGLTAQARAINRSAVTARTFMQRQVSADLKLPSRRVRDAMRVENAKPTRDGLRARIIISGKRIPLIDFGARQVRRGVTANTGQGRKTYPGAFIATMNSGHRGVYQRKGKTRLPIIEKFGPSLPHVFGKHIPGGLAVGEDALQKNLAHELRFALKRSAST